MKGRSILLLAPLVLAVLAVNSVSQSQRIKQSLPSTLNDLDASKTVEIKDAAGQVILSGTFTTTSELKSEIERTATLVGADGDAKGKAEIELVKKNGSVIEQELEVELEELTPSASFGLFVDGNEVITFKAGKSGKVSLKFSSKYSK